MAVARRIEEVQFQQREEARETPSITEEQIMGLLKTAMNILGARLLLVIGLVGAIMLAYLAIQAQSPMALWALAIFCIGGFNPLVWLSSKRSI